jgi:serine/threonine-protein kinase
MSWGALVGAAVAILLVAGLVGFYMFNNREETPQLVSMPNVQNQDFEEARATLEGPDFGLTVAREDQVTENEDEVGTVLAQDPAPLEQVERGSTVTLTVGVAPDDVTVPANLVGMPQAEAEAAIVDAGLEVGDVSTDETTDEQLAGTVASTSPAPGESVPPGTPVDLVVYSLPDTVAVPDLEGMNEEQADTALAGVGLQLGTVRDEPHDSISEGRVTRSDPASGEEVAADSRIDIWLSTGPDLTEVPNVSNGQFNEEQARQFLDQFGFEADPAPAQDCNQPDGIVISQDPAAGSEAPTGSAVRIGVNDTESCEGDGNGGGGDGGG